MPSTTGLPFATYGSASWAQAGSKLTVNQTSTNAILNWQSFNISADGTVQFVQPSSGSVALNEIYDSNPTQIFGALSANGHIILINQNGIIFGAGAAVSVGGLIASTLQISPSAAVSTGSNANYLGLSIPGTSGTGASNTTGQPAFQATQGVVSQGITVQQGATLEAADGGQIMLFAPDVTNLGTIHTPDGQAVLAAGSSVYLSASNDPNLRGVLVEVQGTGTVQNGLVSNSNVTSPQQLVGQIIAEHGNISLAAVAVNQYGRLSATTSVNENGSIYLQARTGTVETSDGVPTDLPDTGGTLLLGQNSDTEVTLDTADPTVEVDSVAQPPSTIQMSGDKVDMQQGSVARATGGVVDVSAAANLGTLYTQGLAAHASDGSRFYMAPGSLIDVSGASVTQSVSDDVIDAKLEATELADSPLLRNGPLHGQAIDFDVRAHGTNADGTTWWGTPIANVSGEILGITRNVAERNLAGGTVNIQSQGDAILAPSSKIDVSGGSIQYTGGYIDTSELMTLWGQTVPVGSASPNIPYAGVVNSTTATDVKWGVTNTYQTTPSFYSPGYVEGKDAGSLSLSATSFILDGTVSANTVVGPYQTLPTTARDSSTWVQAATSNGSSYGLYRPYDEVPAGGTLRIGTPGGSGADLVVNSNITIAADQVLDGLKNADGSAFDPLTDPLPANFTTSILQPSTLDAFQNVSVYTNGNLTESAGVSLSLAPGGSFTGQAASIDIEGGIDVPSGTIKLAAEPTWTDQASPDTGLTLGGSASLTARGAWVNDSSVLYPAGNPAPLYINGGTISLTASNPSFAAASSLLLKPGSLIDVSGGAQLTSSGSLNAGKGGSITIDASTVTPQADQFLSGVPVAPSQFQLDATLQGYGLYEGGSLSIGAPGICIAASDCSGGDPFVQWLSPQFFNSGGFSSYSVTADQKGLSIASGMDLQLVQQNLLLPSDYRTMPDAPTLVGLATPTVLPLQMRQPVDLSLALYFPANSAVNSGGSNYLPTLSFAYPVQSLTLPQGDVIGTDPGGSLSLASDTQLDVEGTLRAPGGKIFLTLDFPGSTNINQMYYDPAQAIWLGSSAILDASGAPEIFPNSAGKLTGSVLGGGTVSLTAAPGYVELLPGSVIDVRGSSGVVDINPVGGGLTLARQIASAGGEIDISSSDGAVIGGSLLAAAGTAGPGPNQPESGSLYLTEDAPDPHPQVGFDDGASSSDIRVSPALAPTVVAPGSPVPDALEGLTLLPANTLAQAGFSIIGLTARADDPTAANPVNGTIELSGGATLTATREVSLDSPVYSVDAGTTATVEAPYVEFGNSGLYPSLSQVTAGTGTLSGTGVLNVSGGFIELYGTSYLNGIGTANFDSAGDIRVRGLQYGSSSADPAITGALYATGTVNLTSQQTYPTTLTQFVISADPSFDPSSMTDPTNGSIVVQGSEGANTDLLSAGGSLTLVAASITQDGVLRAPLGTIALDATSLTLGSGSFTSTSADGVTIPFGTTQGNTQGGAQSNYDWTYPLQGHVTSIYGTDGLPVPSQHIELNAANVGVQSGAVIDISGGGDLQAYEWVPGTGGTQDLLACGNCYAIVPSLHANVAPYDPAIAASTGTNLQVGDAVYLSAGSGVPAGTYILLPARYALLPGAYLVTPMAGTAYQDMQPGQTFTAPDGGTIVSGYLTGTGVPFGSSRLNGFDVTAASIFLNESQYNLTAGNQFFAGQEQALAASAAAASEAVSAMRLPEDAGVLDVSAGSFLTLDGTLRATAPNNARGGEVDISNPNIVVAANASDANQSGALVLITSSLDQLAAQTLVLGGTDDKGTIDTTAQTITVLGDASLSGPQLLLTAQQQISVQGGASITAAGTAPSSGATYALADAGAFLGVSAGPQVTVAPTGANIPQGDLDLAGGSSVNANTGSVYLYATSGITTDGSIGLSKGSLAVQAPEIALGNAANAPGLAVLGASLLGDGSLDNLLLVSPAAITIADGAAASAQNITIDAPGLVSGLAAGQSATLSAMTSLSLGNTQGTAASSGSGVGGLTLSAPAIVLQGTAPAIAGTGTPTFNVEGFGTVALAAQGTLTAAHDIDFSVDFMSGTPGNLSIGAAAITTGAGATATIAANNGSVALLDPQGPDSPPSTTALGGSLAVTGTSIELGTRIELPSGNVALTATSGNIALDSGGAIDVAGVAQQYDTETIATPGGAVALSATSGDIDLASGSSIDVSAGTGGMAGSLSISAPMGQVAAQGTLAGNGAQQGGSFSVDAQSFGGGFGSLSAAVNAGGFSSLQSYRLRGNTAAGSDNDLSLANGETLQASTVLLEADQGAIDIEGNVDARGNNGGDVTLAAANGITVDGGIDASATASGGNGGTVELDVENAGAPLTLGSNSLINVIGGGVNESAAGPGATAVLPGSGGTVLMRVQYDPNLPQGISGLSLDPGARIQGASSTFLEAYQPVSAAAETDPSGNVDITGSEFSGWQQNAQNIMTAVQPVVSQQNASSGLSVVLEPGIEIDATGNITLDTNWLLGGAAPWRFGVDNVPGILTLRAGGSVMFNSSLSDGFNKATGGKLLTQDTSSWSYRIVAGADLNAASPLAVGINPTANVTIGNASTGTGATVRTGTGFIDIAASGNFALSTAGSVLYTAGALDAVDPPASTPTCDGSACLGAISLPAYTLSGGDISIETAGDVQGAAGANQFVNDWLWRQGGSTSSGTDSPTGWSVQFTQFQDGIAALGGGDVAIRAGGNVQNVLASIASIGVSTGGGVEVKNAGDLTVSAGGSILGGSFYVGLGSAALSAGGAIGAGQDSPISPLIALGEASVSVTARGDVQVSGIVNPTLLNSSQADGPLGAGSGAQNYFSTYGPASSASLVSVGGKIDLEDEYGSVGPAFGSGLLQGNLGNPGGGEGTGDAPGALAVVTPSLTLASLSGDVDVNRPIMLFPSSQGNLEVLAAKNITVGSSVFAGQIVVPDVDPSVVPSIAAPAQALSSLIGAYPSNSTTPSQEHGSSPLFQSVAAFDEDPVTLVASTGNVDTTYGAIWSGKPVILSAGQDILDLTLTAQNISAGDVTSITAGGDILYPQLRTPQGAIQANTSGIVVAGPGQLQVTAGGNVDLGASNGITTIGNEQNTALVSKGASVSVQAGVGATSATAAQYSAFVKQYIDGGSQFDGQVVSYVEEVTGEDGLTDAEAKQQFDSMAPEQQRTFVEQLFFMLLRTNGEAAAKSGNNADFAGAYAAIQTLYPGANPDLSQGESDPYSGNISLYFSQIYTYKGGDISLIAPGGQVNAGLALAPTSYGLGKAANQLGVVAEGPGSVDSFSYGDFQVNQSRVFAADGGNILVWSTEGNIDAGRGSKTSLSAAAPGVTYDLNEFDTITFFAPTSGSGIQTLADTPGTTLGSVDLFAPHGVVNANDAGIVAGNLTIAATAVLGASNITVTGTEVGVPVAVTGTGASVVGASSSAGGALSSAQSNLVQAGPRQQEAPKAAAELRWLDVFVLGFGEQTCSASDIECLKRQKHTAH